MRKYRGLTKEGKWVYGWFFIMHGNFYIIPKDAVFYVNECCSDKRISEIIEVIPETVGQFTGLKDKNGKELDWWEGDIFDDAEVLKFIVKDKGCFWFENIESKRRIPCYQVAESNEWPHDIRKVGDIHTTPELLEQENA